MPEPAAAAAGPREADPASQHPAPQRVRSGDQRLEHAAGAGADLGSRRLGLRRAARAHAAPLWLGGATGLAACHSVSQDRAAAGAEAIAAAGCAAAQLWRGGYGCPSPPGGVPALAGSLRYKRCAPMLTKDCGLPALTGSVRGFKLLHGRGGRRLRPCPASKVPTCFSEMTGLTRITRIATCTLKDPLFLLLLLRVGCPSPKSCYRFPSRW